METNLIKIRSLTYPPLLIYHGVGDPRKPPITDLYYYYLTYRGVGDPRKPPISDLYYYYLTYRTDNYCCNCFFTQSYWTTIVKDRSKSDQSHIYIPY